MSELLKENVGYSALNSSLNDCSSSEEFSPTIILKKGKMELKVRNAAAIIKKIDELYPGDSSYTGWNCNWNKVRRDMSDVEKAKQRRWMDAAKTWFQTEMFGGSSDFEVVVGEEKTQKESIIQEVKSDGIGKTLISNDHVTTKVTTELNEKLPESQIVHSVNKNAYEIRTDILSMALDWMKFKRRLDVDSGSVISDDDVLGTAKRFYAFVENKR